MNYLILIIYINLQSVSISILMACKMLSLKTKSSILWTCSKITLISLIRWISLMRILYVRQKYSLNCYIRLQLEISTFYLPIIDRHLWAKLVYHNKDTSIRWSFTMIAYSDVSFCIIYLRTIDPQPFVQMLHELVVLSYLLQLGYSYHSLLIRVPFVDAWNIPYPQLYFHHKQLSVILLYS